MFYSLFSEEIIPARWLIFVDGFSHIIIFLNLWTDVLNGSRNCVIPVVCV